MCASGNWFLKIDGLAAYTSYSYTDTVTRSIQSFLICIMPHGTHFLFNSFLTYYKLNDIITATV